MQQPAKSVDPVEAETKELDQLTKTGLTFMTQKRSLLRFFGKPTRTFFLQQPYLGTMEALGRQYAKMDFSEKDMLQGSVNEAHRLSYRSTLRCARVIAIAVLNGNWKIKLFTPLLTRYFLWHLTPGKLFHLAILVNNVSKLPDFINAIRLLSISPRTTEPAPVKAMEEALY